MAELLHEQWDWGSRRVPGSRVAALLRAWGPQAAYAERVVVVWRLLLRLQGSALPYAWCTRAQPWVAHALGWALAVVQGDASLRRAALWLIF